MSTQQLPHPWKTGQFADLTAEQRDFQAAVLARTAAVELEKHGWKQHGMGSGETPKCLVGAVNHVLFEENDGSALLTAEDELVRDHLFRTLEDLHAIPKLSVVPWNDEPGRQASEVVAALRATAEHLHPQAGVTDA